MQRNARRVAAAAVIAALAAGVALRAITWDDDARPVAATPTDAPVESRESAAPRARHRADAPAPVRPSISGRVGGLADGATATIEVRRLGGLPLPGLDEDPLAPTQWRPESVLEDPGDPPAADVTVRTGTEGAFRIEAPGAGAYSVTARADDGRTVSARVELPAPDSHAEARLDLPGTTCLLRGRVVRADGTPFDGVVTIGFEDTGERPALRVRPDDDGRFEVRGLPQGEATVAALLPGEESAAANVTLPVSEELTLTLGGGRRVAGRVVADADDSGVAGARVTWETWDADGRRATCVVTAGPDGRFAAPLRTEFFARAVASGFGDDIVASDWLRGSGLHVPPDGPDGVVLRLRRTGVVAGRVLRAPDGPPVAGAVVVCQSHAGTVVRTESAADGTYRLGDAGPGEAYLFALGGGWASVGLATADADPAQSGDEPQSPFRVSVPAGGAVAYDLRVEPTGGVCVRAFGPSGGPVAGARITLDPGRDLGARRWRAVRSAWTASDGTCSFDGLPAGTRAALRANLAGMAPADASARIEAGAVTDSEIRFVAAQLLEVTVIDAADGRPVAGAQVDPVSVSDEDSLGSAGIAGVTGSDGRCCIRATGGALAVLVTAKGFGPVPEWAPVRAVRDGADASRWRAEVRLDRVYVVRGRAWESDGAPAEGVSLVLFRADGPERVEPGIFPVDCEADGSFRFDDVPRGRWSIRRWTQHAEILATVEAGDPDVQVRFPKGPGGPLTVRVVDAAGADVARGGVRFRSGDATYGAWLDGAPIRLASDFRLTAEVEVRLWGLADPRGDPLPYGAGDQRFPDAGAGPLVVRPPAERPLRGRVVAPDGRGVAGARLNARFADDLERVVSSVVSSADGAFDLRGLGDGAWTLAVEPPAAFLRPEPQDAEGGSTDVVVRLAAAAHGVVRVADADGTPLPGAQVVVTARTPPDAAPLASRATDERGEATVGGLVPGTTCRLTVTGPADRTDLCAWISPAWVPADTQVRMTRGRTIRCIVVRADGLPAAWATVLADSPGGMLRVEADRDGHATVPAVPTGETRRLCAVSGSRADAPAGAVWTTATAGDTGVRLVQVASDR